MAEQTPGAPSPETTSRLEVEASIDAPSAAAADDGRPAADPDHPPAPLTAWTSPQDCQALAQGLKPQVNPAEWAFARLSRMIEDFEKKLTPQEEVGAYITAGPDNGEFRIEDVGFWGPDLILFFGRNRHGKPVRLIQHYTQLNVLLSALPIPKEEERPRRIGFVLRERMEQAAAEAAPTPPAAEPSRPAKRGKKAAQVGERP